MRLNFINKIVALASTSPIKYSATTSGFPKSSVSKNNVKSGVDEQPFNTDTIEGVFGRLQNLRANTSPIKFYDLVTNTSHTLKAKVEPSHFYVSIESGIFTSDMKDNKIIPPIAKGKYFDHAIIGIMNGRGEIIVSASEGVEFPADCVEEAQTRGFDKFTAAMIMQEKGEFVFNGKKVKVTNHKDPHLGLTGKKRQSYLLETIQKMQDNNQTFFE